MADRAVDDVLMLESSLKMQQYHAVRQNCFA
jgi:hypothetical protein